MDIIEKAARELALQADGTDKNWKEFVSDVRCVLAAIREPSEAMQDAYYAEEEKLCIDGLANGLSSSSAWRSMIDAALTPPNSNQRPIRF